jgi:hypothetical protein
MDEGGVFLISDRLNVGCFGAPRCGHLELRSWPGDKRSMSGPPGNLLQIRSWIEKKNILIVGYLGDSCLLESVQCRWTSQVDVLVGRIKPLIPLKRFC